jgi:hypothetical protein
MRSILKHTRQESEAHGNDGLFPSTITRSHGSSEDDSSAGDISANGELEEGGGLPPDNAIITVPIGCHLPLFSSIETRHRIAIHEVGAGNEYDADKASLNTNMSQGTMATLGTLGREMREIQILAADESLPDAAPADVSLLVKNVGNYDTSGTSTIIQTTFNSSAAGFEALAQALSQQIRGRDIRLYYLRQWRRLIRRILLHTKNMK